MEKPLSAIFGPVPSEEQFNLALRLAERPSSSLPTGFKDWKQMYRLARESGDSRTTAVALQNIFSSLVSAGMTADALLCARWFFVVALSTADKLVICHALSNIAWTYWMMGDHVAALEAARKVIADASALEQTRSVHPMSAFTGPHEVRSTATELLRTIRQSRGQLRRALADQEAALTIRRERGDPLRLISALEGLGLVYKDLNDYAGAARVFSEAIRETETASISDERMRLFARAGLLGNLGVVLTYQGNTDQALAAIDEQIKIFSSLSDEFGRIAALGQKGRALLRAGKGSESLLCLAEMLELSQEFNADSSRYAAHFNLSRAHIAAGSLSDAALHCEQAIALARERLGRVGVDVLWLRAILFAPAVGMDARRADVGRFVALAYHAIDALREEIRGSLPPVVVGRWIDEFEILIDAIFRLPPGESLQLGHDPLGSSRTPAERTISEVAEASPFLEWVHLDIGLYCVESLRAQLFQERLLLNAADLEQGHDRDLVFELARTESEIEKLDRSQPIVVTGKAAFGADGKLELHERESEESIGEQQAVQREHYRRRAELGVVRDTLARRTVEGEDIKVAPLAEPARLAGLRKVLREDELFLEFVLLGQAEAGKRSANEIVEWPASSRATAAYAIAVTRSWMDVIPLGPTEEIESRCAKLLDMLDRFGASLSLPFFLSEAAALHDLLLAPVWRAAGGAREFVRHLIIAADGVLHKLPLDLLVEERKDARSWGDVDFLARHLSMEYVASATLFTDARLGRFRRGEPGKMFIGFADPIYTPLWQPIPLEQLPGTRRELDVITALVRASASSDSDPVRVFLDSDARKDFLTDSGLLAQAKYIHLACHGSAATTPYAEGALYLAQTGTSPPIKSVITSREVMDLRTNARLVVLSACESGSGALSRGEGIQGLSRAWLFAGAEAVVASQWRVDDDATAEVMAELYRTFLARPESAADALVAAKRAAIASDRYACPVFWAAFVLTGGRAGKSPKLRETESVGALSAASTIEAPGQQGPLPATLNERDRALLEECARAWEAAWETDKPEPSLAFCRAAMELGRSLSGDQDEIEPTARSLLRFVERNCRIALDHWAKRQQAAVAIQAYLAYVTWLPSARTHEWDAVASAYRRENRDAVRLLTKSGTLVRTFELVLDETSDATLRTAISWVAARSDEQIVSPVKVALPVEPSVSSTSEKFRYCRQLGWAVFPVGPGETIILTERLRRHVHFPDENTLIVGGTWGSSQISHDLTIRFHPDFIPLRCQRERLGKSASTAAIRFTSEGAIVTLRPNGGPWLERVAILAQRAPGALAMFSGPNSPFLSETEFEHFESLLDEVRKRSTG